MEIAVIVCLVVLGLISVVLAIVVLGVTRMSHQHNEGLIRGLLGEVTEAREASERFTEKVIDPGAIHSHVSERTVKSQSLPEQIKMWNPPGEALEPPEIGPVEEQYTIPRG